MPLSEGVWMVSGGVWMVSGWDLRVSEDVLIPNNNKYVINKIILGHDIQKLAFIPVSCTA